MRSLMQSIQRFGRDERGAIATEYVILVGVVGLTVLTTLMAFAVQQQRYYETAETILLSEYP